MKDLEREARRRQCSQEVSIRRRVGRSNEPDSEGDHRERAPLVRVQQPVLLQGLEDHPSVAVDLRLAQVRIHVEERQVETEDFMEANGAQRTDLSARPKDFEPVGSSGSQDGRWREGEGCGRRNQ